VIKQRSAQVPAAEYSLNRLAEAIYRQYGNGTEEGHPAKWCSLLRITDLHCP
jgi:hypothetical protein